MKLFIDVDDTLILYAYPETKINYPLIRALETWQREHPKDVLIVWSGTGALWATNAAERLLPHLSISLTGDKSSPLLSLITNKDIAIDDRSQESREYLKDFKKVYSPEEFIAYAKKAIAVVS